MLAELQLIAIMLRSQFGPATVDEENQAVELQVREWSLTCVYCCVHVPPYSGPAVSSCLFHALLVVTHAARTPGGRTALSLTPLPA